MCLRARVSPSILMQSTFMSCDPQVQWGRGCSQVRTNPSPWMWMRRRIWVSRLWFFFPHFSVWAIASISFQMPACIFVSLFSARMPSLVCLLPPLLWCVISVKTFYSLIFPSMSVLRLHFIKREIQYNIKLIKLEQNLCILFDEKKNSTVELRKCDKNKD